MKTLYLVRGLPGSGKSTFAKNLCHNVIAADDYFMVGDEYKFNQSKIKEAHKYCRDCTRIYMEIGEDVAVANTFTRDWEMEEYFRMAKEFDYAVFSVIVENRHGSENVHNVPKSVITNMRDRFEIKL